MLAASDITMLYDGSTDGFFTCVCLIFERRQLPVNIAAESEWEPSFYTEEYVETDREKAQRVRTWLNKPENRNARSVMRRVWLSPAQGREHNLAQYFYLCTKHGARAWNMVQEPAIIALHQTVVTVHREIEKYLGFVRFSDYGGVLVSTIEPKSFVLPLLQRHFCDRYAVETFLIYDKTHKAALLSSRGNGRIVALDNLILPPPNAKEVEVRNLWRHFYNTIAIESRVKPALRRNLMPKRYWGELTEMQPFEDVPNAELTDAEPILIAPCDTKSN